MAERIQKLLAQAGYGSRREIEQWIEQGRVSVNRKVVSLGARAGEKDVIYLDGKPLSLDLEKQRGQMPKVIAYHKDVGVVCTRKDPEQRPNVFQDFPKIKHARWVLIGRLDINTSGLLLATTDGELANRLMHPSHEVEREYAVRVFGAVDDEVLKRLRKGVELDDGEAHFSRISDVGGEGRNHWYRVVLKEGRYREVRRLWESQGVVVNRLSRIRYGPVSLPRRLKRGHCETLDTKQLAALYKLVDLPLPEGLPGNLKRKFKRKQDQKNEAQPPKQGTGKTFSKQATKPAPKKAFKKAAKKPGRRSVAAHEDSSPYARSADQKSPKKKPFKKKLTRKKATRKKTA